MAGQERKRKLQLEQELQEMTQKYEQSKQAMIHITQALGNPPAAGNSNNLENKLDQLIAIMKSNKGSIDRLTQAVNNGVAQESKTVEMLAEILGAVKNPPLSVNQLIYQYGLTDILTGSLHFIKSRLTVENGDLVIDGKKINDVAWFKRIIQTQPWILFSGEYGKPSVPCSRTTISAMTSRRKLKKRHRPKKRVILVIYY